MSQIFDTGDIALDKAGSDVPNAQWSDLEVITLINYGCKIIKVLIECVTASSVTGNLHIFSETYDSWANTNPETQAPVDTTGHVATIAFDDEGTINDTVRYFMNNDTSRSKKMYIAIWNSDATAGQFKVRILYELLSLGT